MRSVVLLSLFLAPTASAVTFGSNPNTTSLVAPAALRTLTVADADATLITLTSCSDQTKTGTVDLDLVAGTEMVLPPGMCSMDLSWVDVQIDGSSSLGGTFSLLLEPSLTHLDVVAVDGLEVEDAAGDPYAFILEVADVDWLDLPLLNVPIGQHVNIGTSHPDHDALAAAITSGTALYVDANGDGVLSSSERSSGPVAEVP